MMTPLPAPCRSLLLLRRTITPEEISEVICARSLWFQWSRDDRVQRLCKHRRGNPTPQRRHGGVCAGSRNVTWVFDGVGLEERGVGLVRLCTVRARRVREPGPIAKYPSARFIMVIDVWCVGSKVGPPHSRERFGSAGVSPCHVKLLIENAA